MVNGKIVLHAKDDPTWWRVELRDGKLLVMFSLDGKEYHGPAGDPWELNPAEKIEVEIGFERPTHA